MSGVPWDTLRDLLGSDALVQDPTHPTPVVAPTDAAGVAAVVDLARARGLAVLPIGTGRGVRTRRDAREALLLSTRRMHRIVAHEAGDLTLTVEAGASLRDIARVVGDARQFVAIDPVHENSTIGGALAAARDGAFAGRCGPVRDQVLGMAVVNGDARITKSGGRVVKNVTGYDLVRLYVGSLGTLGILTEVTLRLRPLPERHAVLIRDVDTYASAFDVARRLRHEIADLTTLHVVAGIDGATARIRAGVAGFSRSVAATLDRIRKAADGTWALSESASAPTWSPPAIGAYRVAVVAPHARWATLGASVDALFGGSVSTIHDVLRGERVFGCDGPPPSARMAALDVLAASSDARVLLLDDPSFESVLADTMPAQLPDGLDLMRGIKRALDPDGILAPRSTLAD